MFGPVVAPSLHHRSQNVVQGGVYFFCFSVRLRMVSTFVAHLISYMFGKCGPNASAYSYVIVENDLGWATMLFDQVLEICDLPPRCKLRELARNGTRPIDGRWT